MGPDRPAVDSNRSGSGAYQRRNQFEKRRLPGSVSPSKKNPFASGHAPGKIRKQFPGRETL